MRFPLTETGYKASLFVGPAVFALVWLFNAYKMGKFRKKGAEYRPLPNWVPVALLCAGLVMVFIVAIILF